MTEENKDQERIKTIKIETGRHPPNVIGSEEHIDFRGIESLITFDNPVKDYHGKENKILGLKTVWFGLGGPYWSMWLEDENGSCICSGDDFNRLHEPFSSYTPERLRQWKDIATQAHRDVLLKIEDLYWQGGEMPKNFLS